MNIGNSIKVIRKNKNISLKTMSELTGMHISKLSKIENNKQKVDYKDIRKFAVALCISTSEILEYGLNNIDYLKIPIKYIDKAFSDEERKIFNTLVEKLQKVSNKEISEEIDVPIVEVKKCSISGCDKIHHAKGFCNACYRKFYKSGYRKKENNLDIPLKKMLKVVDKKIPEYIQRKCSTPGCDKNHHAKGFCDACYRKYKKNLL